MKQYLFIPLIFTAFFFLNSPLQAASSKKVGEAEKKPETYTIPHSISPHVAVLSDFDETAIVPILTLINEYTGLECELVPYSEEDSNEDFDVFIGCCTDYPVQNILPYTSSSNSRAHSQRGVYKWSLWRSCLVVNTVLHKPTDDGFSLYGKITALNPMNDRLTAASMYTLYRQYGREILFALNDLIPLYAQTGTDLIFAVESGKYEGAFAIDGYFKSSIEEGYPVSFNYHALNSERYPVTAVQGENIAFIPENAPNRHGAEHIIDFMASEPFQSFLKRSSFHPYSGNADAEALSMEDYLPVILDKNWFEQFKAVWEEIVFPEGIDKDTVLQ